MPIPIQTALDNYSGLPANATQDDKIAALQALVDAINANPAPAVGPDPDQAARAALATYQSNLAAAQAADYQNEAAANASFLVDLAGGSQANAAVKHYQITVPNFAKNNDITMPGNSFLRLGSFPPDGGTAFPPEFQQSLALANLVGKKDAIVTVESKDLAPKDATEQVQPAYRGDQLYLLGFADDTRVRQSDGGTTWKDVRQAETQKLLTKGGWWDHSDGNRISTTAGDKIDIIQGNYKMVVLGRQDPASGAAAIAPNALIRDISGGMVVENGPSPTHCIKSIEFNLGASGSYDVYQNNGLGNVYSSFYGRVGDVFFGPRKESWTGMAPANYAGTSDFYKQAYALHPNTNAPSKFTPNPEISEHTWAASIRTYKGSDGHRIPLIHDEVWCDKVEAEVNVGSSNAVVMADTTITSTTTAGGAIANTTAAGGIVMNSTMAGGEILNLNVAGVGIPFAGITNVNVSPLGALINVNAATAGIVNVDWTIKGANVHVGVASRDVSLRNATKVASNFTLSALKAIFITPFQACAARDYQVLANNYWVFGANINLGAASSDAAVELAAGAAAAAAAQDADLIV